MTSRWSPSDRLELVESMAAKAEADSAAFFSAHGLGFAYEARGPGVSKKSRISSALVAAEDRGDIDTVLDEAFQYFQVADSTGIGRMASTNRSRGSASNQGRGIFISHASADQAIADLLKSMLVAGGVSEESIFYSSARATGIPSGEDVRGHLQRRLRDAGIVIELVSQTFLQRPWCLIELGGAWALSKSTYPIVVPPLTRSAAREQIGDVQMAILSSDQELDNMFDELMQRIASEAGANLKTLSWNAAARDFKARITGVLGEGAAVKGVKVGRQTMQEELSPILHRIQMRKFDSVIHVKLPLGEVWLGLSTFPQHQFGEDVNPFYIYFSDPDATERPSLDAVVNWSEGRSAEWALGRVREVLRQDPGHRSAADFDVDEVLAIFEQKISALYS